MFVVIAAAVALAGCGQSRQDVKEPKHNFKVEVTNASFPGSQRMSEHTHLVISVRNADSRPIPNLTVTICNVTCSYPAPAGEGTSVAPFAHPFTMPGVSWTSRPTWIVDEPPGVCSYGCAQGGAGADATADANSWQRNTPLPPGGTATFDWAVTAVAPGTYVLAWEIAAGQYGKAKAVMVGGASPCGGTPCGSFRVTIAHGPAQSYVNDSGQVVQNQ